MVTAPSFHTALLINESYYNRLVNHQCSTTAANFIPATTTTATDSGEKLPIDQMQKLYAHQLQEERSLLTREAAAVTAKKDEEEAATEQKLSPAMVKIIIDKFPIYLRRIGHSILQKLIGERVTWDSQGQIKLDSSDEGISSSTIANSNIIDLIYYASRQKSSKVSNQIPPIGWEKINSILKIPPISATAAGKKKKAVVVGKPSSIATPTHKIGRKRMRIEIPDNYEAV